MLEKAITVVCCVLGAGFGMGIADATASGTEPKVYTLGKEAAGGIIFGMAGYKASQELIPMLPTFKKGE